MSKARTSKPAKSDRRKAAFEPARVRPFPGEARSSAKPVGDYVGKVLDPVLERKAGFTTSLIGAWPDIVGPDLGARTRPMKVSWPERAPGAPVPRSAVLTLACAPASALAVQHQTDVLMARINGFLGYAAIGRIRIVQRPLTGHQTSRMPFRGAAGRSPVAIDGIADDGLRASLERLGASIKADRRTR